jgi:hypothetical protein
MKSGRAVLQQGFIAGVVGYVTVAVSTAVMNVLSGHSPFYTVAALARGVFGSVADPGVPATAVGPVIAYNGLHLLVFLVLGWVAAALISEVELHPRIWYLAFFIFLAGFLFTYASMLVLTAELTRTFPALQIAIANLLAAGAIGLYLARLHPALAATIQQRGDPEVGVHPQNEVVGGPSH